MLSRLSPSAASSETWIAGGADELCLDSGCGVPFGVPWPPGGILRMKFIGAFGFASARLKRPAVAGGGKGCWGCTFVRRSTWEEG